jgi:hypothetical protein
MAGSSQESIRDDWFTLSFRTALSLLKAPAKSLMQHFALIALSSLAQSFKQRNLRRVTTRAQRESAFGLAR